MLLLKEFCQFIKAVFSHAFAIITGGVIAASVFVYEHLSGKPISETSLYLWLLTAFVIGSFQTWREVNAQIAATPLRKLELRNKVDELIASGEAIMIPLRKSYEDSLIRKALQWDSLLSNFAGKYFDTHQSDKINLLTQLGPFEHIKLLYDDNEPITVKDAPEILERIAIRIIKLKEIRNEIQG